jgi:hypothetical protein
LNRGDCCAGRLKGAKVFVGDHVCGTVDKAPAGKWININCKASGNFL